MKDSEKIVAGCAVLLAVVVILLPLAFTISAGLIYLLMNVLLPILGVVYPLTLVQCYVAAIAISIVGMFVKGVLGRSSS